MYKPKHSQLLYDNKKKQKKLKEEKEKIDFSMLTYNHINE